MEHGLVGGDIGHIDRGALGEACAFGQREQIANITQGFFRICAGFGSCDIDVVADRDAGAEVIPMAKLEVSIGKFALQYCEKHIGAREVMGNKAGSLSNRLRAVLKKK